jgi:hypothetical protein
VRRLRQRRCREQRIHAEVRVLGGRIVKVVYDVADDTYENLELKFAAALARD